MEMSKPRQPNANENDGRLKYCENKQNSAIRPLESPASTTEVSTATASRGRMQRAVSTQVEKILKKCANFACISTTVHKNINVREQYVSQGMRRMKSSSIPQANIFPSFLSFMISALAEAPIES